MAMWEGLNRKKKRENIISVYIPTAELHLRSSPASELRSCYEFVTVIIVKWGTRCRMVSLSSPTAHNRK